MKKIVNKIPKTDLISIDDLIIDPTKIYVIKRIHDNSVGVYSFSRHYFICLDDTSDGWSIGRDTLNAFHIAALSKEIELFEFENKREFGKWLTEI